MDNIRQQLINSFKVRPNRLMQAQMGIKSPVSSVSTVAPVENNLSYQPLPKPSPTTIDAGKFGYEPWLMPQQPDVKPFPEGGKQAPILKQYPSQPAPIGGVNNPGGMGFWTQQPDGSWIGGDSFTGRYLPPGSNPNSPDLRYNQWGLGEQVLRSKIL